MACAHYYASYLVQIDPVMCKLHVNILVIKYILR